MAKPTGGLTEDEEADLYAPDLDEGELNVERYPVPEDVPEGASPEFAAAWKEAIRLLDEQDAEDAEEEDEDEDEDDEEEKEPEGPET